MPQRRHEDLETFYRFFLKETYEVCPNYCEDAVIVTSMWGRIFKVWIWSRQAEPRVVPFRDRMHPESPVFFARVNREEQSHCAPEESQIFNFIVHTALMCGAFNRICDSQL